MSQADAFIKIDGIDGESTDDKHKGEIDVESWSWGQSNSGSAGHGGGAGTGKVSPQDLSFTKRMDKGSPKLMLDCATGAHHKTAVLTARKAGEGQQTYLKITLSEVLISSYQTGASSGSGMANESVTLNFAKLEMSYWEQKEGGGVGGEIKQGYDYAKNVKV